MLLDDREIALLARFFAKRFPHVDDRRPLLERAGLSDSALDGPVAAWEDIVSRAQQARALSRLGRALKTDDPDDVNLREVRHLLADDVRPGWSTTAALLGGVAALAVVVVAAGAWTLGSRALSNPEPPSVARVAAAPVESAPVPAVVAAVPEAAPAPIPEVPAAASPEPAPVVVAPAPPAQVAAAPIEPGADRHVAPDHCARKGGEVGGWWYAGAEPPGKAGDVIVVERDAYVRAEVPGTSNGWNTRTPVRCVLYAGDKVRLTADPVPVPVGAWWVSTTSADVVVAGGKRVRDRG